MTEQRPITHTMPSGIKSIACLGDSITAGYFDEEGLGWVTRFNRLLAQNYPMQYHAQSCGISGDTVVDAWHNLLSKVTQLAPDILIIKIGVNDTNILEGIEPESLRISRADRMNYWIKILQFAKTNFEKTLVVAPLPISQPVIRFAAWPDDPEGLTSFRFEQDIIKTYNQDIEKLCFENNVPFLSLFDMWVNEGGLDELMPDGLHPNAAGHEKLAQDIYKKFKEIGF